MEQNYGNSKLIVRTPNKKAAEMYVPQKTRTNNIKSEATQSFARPQLKAKSSDVVI